MSAFVPLAVIGLLAILARRPTRLGRVLRKVGVVLLWVVGALTLLVIAVGFLGGFMSLTDRRLRVGAPQRARSRPSAMPAE